MGRDAGDGDGRLHADEDQQRRHQESAADPEHAGNESDSEAHRQHQKDVDGNVGDRKVNLHGWSAGARCRRFGRFYARNARSQLSRSEQRGDLIAPRRQLVLAASGTEALADDRDFGFDVAVRFAGGSQRTLHSSRFHGLRQRRPFFNVNTRCRERLFVEMGGHFVTLLRCVLVAFSGRQEEPLVGFGEILLDTKAAREKDGEVVLAVGDAVLRGLAEPLRGRPVVAWAVDAFGIKDGQIVHGLAVTFIGRGAVEVTRPGEVLLHADAFFVKACQPELRWCQALLGSALEPVRCAFIVLRNRTALGEANRHLIGGRWIAGESGRAQRRAANRRRQLVSNGHCRGRSHIVRRRSVRQRTGNISRGPRG